jgi:hypothetical protein
MTASELLKRVDAEWEQAARTAHKGRIIVGAIDLALGTAALGTGLFFLLANPVANMSRSDQYNLGNALAGTGLPLAAFGVRSLLQRSLEETSWDGHRAAACSGEPARALVMPRLGVVPLRDGAAAVARFTF